MAMMVRFTEDPNMVMSLLFCGAAFLRVLPTTIHGPCQVHKTAISSAKRVDRPATSAKYRRCVLTGLEEDAVRPLPTHCRHFSAG